MCPSINRRCFLKSTAASVLCSSTVMALVQRLGAAPAAFSPAAKSKARVGKVYVGRQHAGWPTPTVDLPAEAERFEAEFAKLAPALNDIEFVEGGIVSSDAELAGVKEKFKDLDGILAIHLSMGVVPIIKSLLELEVPLVLFTLPYSGHEWHTVAGLQREGKLIEVLPSSQYQDLTVAVRPFRAMHRLKTARVLHISTHQPDAAYVQAIRERFGTEIIHLTLPDLEQAYQQADQALAQEDAERWMREAEKIVEPSKEDILKASRMSVALMNLLAQHQAEIVTMNCLGMGLVDRGMAYPCLGFVRLNNMGLGGVCEADLKSTMTQLIFNHLVGKPGFVTDPVFDLSNDTIIHAHCVAATRMLGPDGPAAPYHIRTHLEDHKGVSLQVRLPIGQKISMARLIGTDIMLFSTGEAVDSPFVDRGCRTKLTMRVEHIEKFLEGWSCGLHRVVFYGDHTRDLRRFCRFKKIRLLQEGIDDLHNVPGLEWETHVHA